MGIETILNLYTGFWLALFGACLGSFLNVVVYRLPKGIFWQSSRSFCPACEKALTWRDLIPVFSWLMLRGRCRYCREKISARYPLVEFSCALLAVVCFLCYGFNLRLIIAFLITILLLCITLIDHDTMEIPNGLILALIPFAIGSVWVFPGPTLVARFIGLFAISVPMFLLTLVIEGAFGEGDIKLMAVCGFLLGWQGTLLAFFIALLTGGGYAVYLLVSGKGKRGQHIAFGPSLCAGVFIALLWGEDVIRFYLGLFGL